MALQIYTLALGNLKDDQAGNNYSADTPVYILKSDGLFANIYRDSSGSSLIIQNGIDNISNASGEFTFYVESGQYIARVNGKENLINVIGSTYFDSRVEDSVSQIIEETQKSRGFRVVGTFADGFTYELFNDVGIDASGNSWIYVGAGAPNKIVTAGTVPSAPDYEQVIFNALQQLSGLDQPSDLDKKYSRESTVSEVATGIFSVGSSLNLSDRAGAKFTVVNGGTADGFGIIDAGNGNTAQILKRGKMYVEMFGVSQANDAVTNTQAFHAAFDFMGGEQIYMLGNRYSYSGSYSGNVNLTGEKRPTVSADRGALENGAILVGTTNFSGAYVYLIDVGVDHGVDNFATGADAVKASASPYNSGRLCVLHGVVGVGRNDTDAFHAVLVEGYEQAWVTECAGARNQFACAIKSRNVEIDGFRSIEGGNGMIIKSDTGGAAGSATNVNLSNYTHSGSATSNYALRILSDSAQLQRLNINNVNFTSVDRGIILESAAALNDVNISNVNGNDVRLFGLVTSGSIFNVNLSNINMVELGDYAGQLLAGSHVTMSNCYFSLKTTSPHIDTAFRVESGCSGFSANDLDIVVNRSNTTKGVLYLANAGSQNTLTNVRALLGGNIPEPGVTSENVDGGVINPAFHGDTMRSIVKLSASAPTTITEITTTMPGTSRAFPTGYRVTLMSIGQTMTYQNGVNMRMKVSGDQVRLVNQLIEFVWMGSSWHQADGTPS